jgi:hypothetical protein
MYQSAWMRVSAIRRNGLRVKIEFEVEGECRGFDSPTVREGLAVDAPAAKNAGIALPSGIILLRPMLR